MKYKYTLTAYDRARKENQSGNEIYDFKIYFNDKNMALKVADLLVNDWCIIVDDNVDCIEIY